MAGWLVALDFGTTATAVGVRFGEGPARALVFGDGSSTLPSSVFAEPDGRLLVGIEADNEAELRLSAYEPTPKRRISDGQIRLADRDFSVAEVIGAVLAPALAEAMQQNNNTTPSQVVLTHPVAWRARRRAVLADALNAAQAQLGVRLPEPVFVAEPVAAARWYSQTDPAQPGAYFAVYDLGGGTFDTTVLQATGEGFEVVASGGIDPLGGFDFDAALFDYLGRHYIEPADAPLWSGLSTPGQPDPELARQRRRLQQRVGLVKLGLSTAPDKRIQLPGVHTPVVVTRAEYEALITGHIDNTVGELEDTIADAGLTPGQLTAIYRIGGAARTPLVEAALDRLRVPVKVLDQPKLVVAQGAASPTDVPTPVSVGGSQVNRTREPLIDAADYGHRVELTPHPLASAHPDAAIASAGPPPGLSRLAKIAMGALAAFAASVGLVTTLIFLNTPSPTPFTQSPSDTGQPSTKDGSATNPASAQPTTQLMDSNQLLAAVPADANCRASTPENGAVAALDCFPAGSGGMTYYSYSGADGMNSYFNSSFDGSNKNYASQPCPGMGQSPQYWHRVATPQQIEGKVGCGTALWTTPPTPYLTFTIDSDLVVGWIQGAADASIDSIYQWWAAHYQ